MPQREERLMSLLSWLLSQPGPVTMRDACGVLMGYEENQNEDSLRRRWSRDIKSLREAGFPVQSSAAGVWLQPQEAFLESIDLNEMERDALAFIKANRRDQSPELKRALRKLLGSLPQTPLEQDHVLTYYAGDDTAWDQRVLDIGEALEKGQTVCFSYRARGQVNIQERQVDPWSLGYREGRWVLVGYCHLRQEKRSFVVNRIEGDVQLGSAQQHFPPDDFDLQEALATPSFANSDQVHYEAVVVLDPILTRLLGRDLPGEQESQSDGSSQVTVPVFNESRFHRWLLSLGTRAQLLGPDLAQTRWHDYLASERQRLLSS